MSSYHEREIVVSDSLANVERSKERGVDSVESIISRPQVAAEVGN